MDRVHGVFAAKMTRDETWCKFCVAFQVPAVPSHARWLYEFFFSTTHDTVRHDTSHLHSRVGAGGATGRTRRRGRHPPRPLRPTAAPTRASCMALWRGLDASQLSTEDGSPFRACAKCNLTDALSLLRSHGANANRMRMWNEPCADGRCVGVSNLRGCFHCLLRSHRQRSAVCHGPPAAQAVAGLEAGRCRAR